MKVFNSIRDNNGISLDVLAKSFPSIMAKRRSPKVSDRYQFLSTAALLEATKDQFVVVEARQRAVRDTGRDPRFTRHMVRLRKAGQKPTIDGVYPEVILQNSHDGQSRWVLMSGLFRLICLNGLVVPFGPRGSIALRHTTKAMEAMQEMDRVLELAIDSSKIVDKMIAKKMTHAKQVVFAAKAAEAAYEEKPTFDPALLLAPRRVEDQGDTVWQVLNRVQENIIRGGVSIPAITDRRATQLRGITHIGRDANVNQKLWALAAEAV